MAGWLKRLLGIGEPGQTRALPMQQSDDPFEREMARCNQLLAEHQAKYGPQQLSAEPTREVPIAPGTRVVAIDCETTGLHYKYDRIVTLGLVEFNEAEKTIDALHLIFNPERKSHPKAREVHGWPDRELRCQEPFSKHAQAIRDWIGDALIVGHNLEFDVSFLNEELRRSGISPIDNRCICTMQNARRIWAGQSATLDACLERIGLNRTGSTHGALEDALLALNLYRAMDEAEDFIRVAQLPPPLNYIDPATVPLTNEEVVLRLAEELDGVGIGLARNLVEAGFCTLDDIASAKDAALLDIQGLGPAKLSRIRSSLSA